MELIRRFKKSLFALCLLMGILFLSIPTLVLPLRAQEASPQPQESAPKEAEKIEEPSSSEETKDPNAVPEETPTLVDPLTAEETKDPNALAEETNEEEDVFSPRISTYIQINEAYDRILSPELITKDGLVDYSTLRRKRNDLINVMKDLKELNPAILLKALSRNEKTAFWINTYNVCVLKLVVDNYPIEPKMYMIFYPDNSVMQISGNWRTKYFFEIQGLEYNLEEIEEEFLLDRYKDPRICFALSYASLGGAVLRNEPYKAETIDEQLDDQVRQYLQSPQGFQFNKEENMLYLSNLFTMHKHRDLFLESEYASIKKFRDRKPDEQAWLNFIWNYLPEDDKRYLETASFDIKFMKYNWLLNESH